MDYQRATEELARETKSRRIVPSAAFPFAEHMGLRPGELAALLANSYTGICGPLLINAAAPPVAREEGKS